MTTAKPFNITSSAISRLLAFSLLSASSQTCMGEEFTGKLFFTPQERTQLDTTYAKSATADGNTSPVLTVNGIVQRDRGPRTVWINGVPQHSRHNGQASPSSEAVALPGKAKTIKLKVGDKILLDASSGPERQTTEPR